MNIKQTLEQIRQKFTNPDFGVKEMEIRQGAVLPLLAEMGWNVFDTTGSVKPEYTVEMDGQNKRSVDFALFGQYKDDVFAFIETKKRSTTLKATEQLFDYLTRYSTPLAIITDGCQWQFYAPLAKGHYKNRLFYSCDVSRDNLDNIANTMSTFLGIDNVRSGRAEESIRREFDKRSADSRIADAIEELWPQTIKQHLPQIIQSFNELTRSELNAVASIAYLKDLLRQKYSLELSSAELDAASTHSGSEVKQNKTARAGAATEQVKPSSGFTLMGHHFPANSAIDALRQVYEELEQRDSKFPVKFTKDSKEGKRPFLAVNKLDLFPDKPHLAVNSKLLSYGWWMDTNLSKLKIKRLIEKACSVAGLKFGTDLKLHF